ncbi:MULTISPECIES: hypothetical protein [unclassified Cryobacterium]|uniref:hypothetical protein n=1 Tax=unclassified Cryobacterium TaxID=2649013 RepID=UPI00106B6031|nr:MULTISPECIES: hypothetical protein [unclassified Cryobacterium]TFC59420.1 hypothetical protein E3O68_00530 [Cryobacterium sp. TMB3-1-2]TFC67216.1 hypothetical protein E3T21_17225 [Cryobacterium sp. TMB3-15]TFC73271.1 hypothetical protein E3T22_16830 [Cryobacterium sp. TMB3-10]TFD46159.1 hypothetical protein E3T58_01465 [Cryobacterium sp. TMB3-12]
MPEPIEPIVEPVTPPLPPAEVPPVAPEAPKPTPPVEPAPVETFDAAYVEGLRKEAAAARIKGRDDATVAAKLASEAAYKELGQKLGLVAAEEESTVESLSAAIQDKDSTISAQAADLKASRLDNALIRVVDKHEADYDLLTDSASFQAKLAAIDTTADDYKSQVDELVKTTVASNTKLRKVQVAPSSGSDAPPAGGQITDPEDIDSFRKTYRENRSGKK